MELKRPRIFANLAIPRVSKFWCWPWTERLPLRHTVNASIGAILSEIFYWYKNVNFSKVNIITWTFYYRFESQKLSSFLAYSPNLQIQTCFWPFFGIIFRKMNTVHGLYNIFSSKYNAESKNVSCIALTVTASKWGWFLWFIGVLLRETPLKFVLLRRVIKTSRAVMHDVLMTLRSRTHF